MNWRLRYCLLEGNTFSSNKIYYFILIIIIIKIKYIDYESHKDAVRRIHLRERVQIVDCHVEEKEHPRGIIRHKKILYLTYIYINYYYYCISETLF